VSVLVQARRDAGLTQRGLAAVLGKSDSHICMIEAGQRWVDALELYRMVKAFEVPPGVLFEQIAARLDALERQAIEETEGTPD
jgi:transcriptional regulator with XRE-family HTH domain